MPDANLRVQLRPTTAIERPPNEIRVFPDQDVPLLDAAMGFRRIVEVTGDMAAGFFTAAGMSGHGFKLAPAIGDMMAALITRATPLVSPPSEAAMPNAVAKTTTPTMRPMMSRFLLRMALLP